MCHALRVSLERLERLLCTRWAPVESRSVPVLETIQCLTTPMPFGAIHSLIVFCPKTPPADRGLARSRVLISTARLVCLESLLRQAAQMTIIARDAITNHTGTDGSATRAPTSIVRVSGEKSSHSRGKFFLFLNICCDVSKL